MKPNSEDDEKWQDMFKKAIVSMCKNGLQYDDEVNIEGVLAVTLDKKNVLVVGVNETLHGSNSSRFLPTIADDIERKKMIAPMLSKLFGSQGNTGQPSEVLVSGLTPEGETLGRLVIENDGKGNQPQARLVINAQSFSTLAALSPTSPIISKVQVAEKSSPVATESNAMETSPTASDTSLSPPPAHQSSANPAQQSGKNAIDLTLKKSLDTVIAKLHKTTPPPHAELNNEEMEVIDVIQESDVAETKLDISVIKGDKRKRNLGLNRENVTIDSAEVDSNESDIAAGPSSNKRPRTSSDPQQRSSVRRFASRKSLNQMEVGSGDNAAGTSQMVEPKQVTTPKPSPRGAKLVAKQSDVVVKQSPRARLLAQRASAKKQKNVSAQVENEMPPLELMPKKTVVVSAEVNRRRSSAESTSSRSVSPPVMEADQESEESVTPIRPNLTRGFGIGMKLEAEDKGNSLVCCATIADVRLGKLRIHFDGWEDAYDFWCHPWASIIHPVGWCQDMEIPLSPPKDCENIDNFTWEEYCDKTQSLPVPERVFKYAIAEHRKLILERSKMKTEEEKTLKKRKVLGSKITTDKQSPIQKPGGKIKRGGVSTPTSKSTEADKSGKDEEDVGRRTVRHCGKCDPCKVEEDCGKCLNCLDKPKYGGHNVRRKKCEFRKCEMRTSSKNGESTPTSKNTGAVTPSSKNTEFNQSKDEYDFGRKVVKYCGKCDSCRLQEDCGTCANCLEKPGGHNTRRKKCELRRCEVYQNPSAHT